MAFGLGLRFRRWLNSKDVASFLMIGALLTTSVSSTIFKNRRYIIKDGSSTKSITSICKEIAEVLRSADVKVSDQDKVFVDEIDAITTSVSIKRAVPVTIFVDGEEKVVNLQEGSTVEEAIGKLGIVLGKDDIVNVSKEEIVNSQNKVIIDRVEYKTITTTEDIPFAVERKRTDTLPKGKIRVEREGTLGKKEITIKEKYVNGGLVEDATEKLESTMLEPVSKIELIGTKAFEKRDTKKFVAPKNNSVEENSAAGFFIDHTGKKVSYSKVLQGPVTGYSPDERGDRGVGSTGTRLKIGHCAVNPKIIPYGTKLYVPGYGYCIAVDTGGAMMRRKNAVLVDLRFNSSREANAWGRRFVKVYILN